VVEYATNEEKTQVLRIQNPVAAFDQGRSQFGFAGLATSLKTADFKDTERCPSG
jgi:hypothetical protein